MPGHIPRGWRPDHGSPEKFVVRCSECGRIGITDDCGPAHDHADSHALTCAPTGVTPISCIENEAAVATADESETLSPSFTDFTDEDVTIVYRSSRTGQIQKRDAVVEEMLTSYLEVPYRGFFARAENGTQLEIDLATAMVFSHGNVRSPTGEFLRVEPTCEDGWSADDALEDDRVAVDGGEA